MDTPVAIEIEGRVNAAAGTLPADMTPAQRATAQRSKVNDILIVLERDRDEIEKRLRDHARRLGGSEGGSEAHLAFSEQDSSFAVTFKIDGAEELPPLKETGAELATAVRDELLAHIGRKATASGRWEPIVLAEPRLPKSAAPNRTWRIVFWAMVVIGFGLAVFSYVRFGQP